MLQENNADESGDSEASDRQTSSLFRSVFKATFVFVYDDDVVEYYVRVCKSRPSLWHVDRRSRGSNCQTCD